MAQRSWDIQRAPAKRPEPATAPAPVRAAPTKSSKHRPAVQEDAVVRPTRPARMPAASLKQRRKKERRKFQILFFVLAFLLAGIVLYLLWLPALRVDSVVATGPGADGVQEQARVALTGTYFYIAPRNSLFLIPEAAIRTTVLATHPDISSLILTRTSFHSLSITAEPRITAFLWCGEKLDTQIPNCFDADAQGFVFKEEAPTDATTTGTTTPVLPLAPASDLLRVYTQLDATTTDPTYPIRAHVLGAVRIPDALQFVKTIKRMGVPVRALALHDGDEADLWVSSSTRITYVLGHEAAAATLAQATLPTLSLTDGSIQYVDLRFGDRVYVKRYASSASPVSSAP